MFEVSIIVFTIIAVSLIILLIACIIRNTREREKFNEYLESRKIPDVLGRNIKNV